MSVNESHYRELLVDGLNRYVSIIFKKQCGYEFMGLFHSKDSCSALYKFVQCVYETDDFQLRSNDLIVPKNDLLIHNMIDAFELQSVTPLGVPVTYLIDAAFDHEGEHQH